VGFFCIGLSILLSSLLRGGFFLFARSERFFPFSGRRSGAAKRDTYRSLHHFVGIEVIWGRRLSRSRGRKEMGILRRAELGGLQLRSGDSRLGSALLVGAEM
jgi:hypothetical protein